jgi:alpha-mannosidase
LPAAAQLPTVQEDDPALYAAIQARVAEGRWSLVNGWWVQPDCNVPCGESLICRGHPRRTIFTRFLSDG